jgi:hypothetical protein
LIRKDTNELVSVEFETVDSSFEKHGHDASKCDIIVCYVKDKQWKNPVTVFELKTQELYPPSK